jgi:hypothetical protein
VDIIPNSTLAPIDAGASYGWDCAEKEYGREAFDCTTEYRWDASERRLG